jgi:hypothetical protein
MKWDQILDTIAGDILGFVDNLQASDYLMEHAWQVARQMASRLQYLGIQVAPRKRRPLSQSPGAWAGAVFSTKDSRVTKLVTQEKWTKAKLMVKELLEEANGSKRHKFSYKQLEQIRGFLCHMAMTYETLTPFLKGIYLTLVCYLPQRDADGWKMSNRKWLDHIKALVKEGKLSTEEGNDAVEAEREVQAPEMEWDMLILKKLDKNQIPEDEAQAALDARIPAGDPLLRR